MATKIELKASITVELDYNEVCRLRALFQNPPAGVTPATELPGDKETRIKMFQAFDDAYKLLCIAV